MGLLSVAKADRQLFTTQQAYTVIKPLKKKQHETLMENEELVRLKLQFTVPKLLDLLYQGLKIKSLIVFLSCSMLSTKDIFRSVHKRVYCFNPFMRDISLTKAVFRKYLKENYRSKYNQQLAPKYFVNL